MKLVNGTYSVHVQHIQDLKKNPILLSTLDSKGYTFSGGGRVLSGKKECSIVLEGRRKSQLYILQGRANFVKKIQHKFSIVVEIQFRTIPLRFGLGSILKNINQSSLKDVGNLALPS